MGNVPSDEPPSIPATEEDVQPGLPPWSTKWGARLTDVELTPAPTVVMDPAAVAKAAPGALVDPSDNVTQARLEEVLTKLTTVPCRGQIKEDVPDGFRIQLVVTCNCDCVCVSVRCTCVRLTLGVCTPVLSSAGPQAPGVGCSAC